MSELIEKYKGIHPKIILEHLLNQKGISQRPFALSISEYPHIEPSSTAQNSISSVRIWGLFG